MRLCFPSLDCCLNIFRNIFVDKVFRKEIPPQNDRQFLKISMEPHPRLFEFATKETHFLLKGNFYDQVDGVAMGSPLAPVLANLFMGHHENIWLDQYRDSEVLFYRRYVDDTFCLFRSERDATLFFNYINNQHPNIRFTMEREADHVLPFLDVLINNTDPHQSLTTVYRKKNFHRFAHHLSEFLPLYLQIGVNQNLD